MAIPNPKASPYPDHIISASLDFSNIPSFLRSAAGSGPGSGEGGAAGDASHTQAVEGIGKSKGQDQQQHQQHQQPPQPPPPNKRLHSSPAKSFRTQPPSSNSHQHRSPHHHHQHQHSNQPHQPYQQTTYSFLSSLGLAHLNLDLSKTLPFDINEISPSTNQSIATLCLLLALGYLGYRKFHSIVGMKRAKERAERLGRELIESESEGKIGGSGGGGSSGERRGSKDRERDKLGGSMSSGSGLMVGSGPGSPARESFGMRNRARASSSVSGNGSGGGVGKVTNHQQQQQQEVSTTANDRDDRSGRSTTPTPTPTPSAPNTPTNMITTTTSIGAFSSFNNNHDDQQRQQQSAAPAPLLQVASNGTGKKLKKSKERRKMERSASSLAGGGGGGSTASPAIATSENPAIAIGQTESDGSRSNVEQNSIEAPSGSDSSAKAKDDNDAKEPTRKSLDEGGDTSPASDNHKTPTKKPAQRIDREDGNTMDNGLFDDNVSQGGEAAEEDEVRTPHLNDTPSSASQQIAPLLVNGHESNNGNGLARTHSRSNQVLSPILRAREDESSSASFTTRSERDREDAMSFTSELSRASGSVLSMMNGQENGQMQKQKRSQANRKRSGGGQQPQTAKRSVPGSAGWTRSDDGNREESRSGTSSQSNGNANGNDKAKNGVPEVSVTSPQEEKETGTLTLRSRQRSNPKESVEYRALAEERDRLVQDNTRLSSQLASSGNTESRARSELAEERERVRLAKAEMSRLAAECERVKEELARMTQEARRSDTGRNGQSNGNANGEEQYRRQNANGGIHRGREIRGGGGRGMRGRTVSAAVGPGRDGSSMWDSEMDSLRREVERRAHEQQRRESEIQAHMQQQAAQLVQALHQAAFLEQALRTERSQRALPSPMPSSSTSMIFTNGQAGPLSNGMSPQLQSYSLHGSMFLANPAFPQAIRTSAPSSPQPSLSAQLGSPWSAINMPVSPLPNRQYTPTSMGTQEDFSKHLAWTVLKKHEGAPAPHENTSEELQQSKIKASATMDDVGAQDRNAAEELYGPTKDGLPTSASLPAGFVVPANSTPDARDGPVSPRSDSINIDNLDGDEGDQSAIPLFASILHDPAHIQALLQAEEERGRRASLRRASVGSSATSNSANHHSPAAHHAKKFGNALSRCDSAATTVEEGLSPFASRSASTATTAMSSVDGAELPVEMVKGEEGNNLSEIDEVAEGKDIDVTESELAEPEKNDTEIRFGTV